MSRVSSRRPEALDVGSGSGTLPELDQVEGLLPLIVGS
jgi:hypothetical protein